MLSVSEKKFSSRKSRELQDNSQNQWKILESQQNGIKSACSEQSHEQVPDA